MILKLSVGSLWQVKAVLAALRLWPLPQDQWKRLYVVCEEWFTNCFKYGGKPKCWIRCQRYRNTPVVCLIDNGSAFNPFAKNDRALGLRLMTKLLKAKYRRFAGKNVFEVCLAHIDER